MQYLIVLALAALAHATHVPLDTPEVAAAKAAHLAEVARLSGAVGAPYYPYSAYPYSGGNVGPINIPVVTPEGYLADTPEVAAAKSVHFAEQARSAAAAAASDYPYSAYPYAAYPYAAYPYAAYPYAAYSSGYSGPLALPVVTPSGHLADTPEVAAAKVAHFAEVAKAQAQA